jgi:RHS repeat-associated protein
LAWERDNDSYTFTNQAVKYQKSTLASYQTSNNLYSGPFGGMENYFANIKTYFGQTKYDQMIEGFMRASILYMDTIKLAEWHIYGSSRIGIYETNLCMASRSVRVESGTETQVNSTTIALQSYTYFTTARGAKRFELTNHLGNVLAVITDKKVAICSTEVFSYWKAELVSATDYSPFGSPMPGRTYQASEYRFAFNGMEKVDEAKGAGNSYDFGARIHDPRLGRFLSVDPEYQKYPSQSSYCFAANSPIRFVDSEGKGVLDKIGAFFSRSYNLITKGDFKTTYEMQKDAYQSALQNRYDYYNMVLEADPTKANNNYLLSIPFLVDKFDAPNPDKDKLSEWKPDAFENTEMYLKSSSKNFGQSSDKVVAGILYGTINSPYILLTGES